MWQVKAADLSLSPIHKAAYGKVSYIIIKMESDKGISLRFPRFERVRDDKYPEQSTDIYQVIEMYKNQQKNAPQSHINSENSDQDN